MKKRYVWFNIAVVALALLIFFGFGIAVTESNHYEEAKKKIIEVTDIYAGTYSDPAITAQKRSEEIRVTVIDASGKVLADSEEVNIAGMGNHIDREEILAALNGTPKTVIRRSETLGVDMVYYAERVERGDGYVFIRTAIPVQSTRSYVVQTIPLMVIVMLGVILATAMLCIFLGMRLLDPIKRIGASLRQVRTGEYRPVLADTGDEEINGVISEINDISRTLQETLTAAQDGERRLDYLLDHISDGIVVLDAGSGMIRLCNQAATQIFELEKPVSKPYTVLSANEQWNENIRVLLAEKKNVAGELKTERQILSYSMQVLENGTAVIVLSDITAERSSSRMRSEFFANASHELKTPLTAIKGFNEIIGMKSTDEEIRKMSGSIGKEADRMIALIGDMLELSSLESGKELHPERLDARAVADEVAEMLSGLAEEKKVQLTIEGDGKVFAEREHLLELMKNLVENAIRYNRPGGFVRVTLSGRKGLLLTVEDNGIGIDAEHQGRIFERFYRVNKSRSRETGGTGLGLAIVKHICSIYHAELTLKSSLGVGTEFTVHFPSDFESAE